MFTVHSRKYAHFLLSFVLSWIYHEFVLWLPARWASGFSGDHQQNHQCLWFHSCYNVIHVFCPSLFAFCWEWNDYYYYWIHVIYLPILFRVASLVLGQSCPSATVLNHWGRVMHICFSKLTIIDLDNGLSPGRHQAIIWTNAGILLIQTSETNFSEILNEIHTFSFNKMHLKMLSVKWWHFFISLNVLITLKDMGRVHPHHITTKHKLCAYFMTMHTAIPLPTSARGVNISTSPDCRDVARKQILEGTQNFWEVFSVVYTSSVTEKGEFLVCFYLYISKNDLVLKVAALGN